MSIAKTYIQYGVRSDWAHNYELIGIASITFKQTSIKNLVEKYNIPEKQVRFVKNCLTRQPIDEKIYLRLLQNSNFICCLCKGTKSDAYLIHHITEYSKTKDNSYKNLAVLCPNDHDLAHRHGIATTSGISEGEIKETKKKWEKEVKKANKEKAGAKSPKEKITDWKRISPYKELQSYAESDKEYFFGRKEEIQELLNRIDKYQIVGLFGESGTGKTSMVNAGLIPVLKNDAFIVISVRCLDDPIKRIRESLLNTLKSNNISSESIERLAATDTFPHFIVDLKSIVEEGNRNFIIIIDQFEEIFTRAKEVEREQLANGVIESLIAPPIKGKLYFMFSLREDYIGGLWDWSHKYKLEVAWKDQYRIKRFSEEKAYEVITEPLHKLNIKTEDKFIRQLVSELKKIGDDLIYPPYLQIVCSELFEEYKNQNNTPLPSIPFGKNLYKGTDNAESIIADYLSESMLNSLNAEEKIHAEYILDLLTGAEGLRAFLSIQEISRHVKINESKAQSIVEHLIRKKIVHPVVEKDNTIGYELVHDFLSKKFFDKLGPEAKKAKTTIELFRKAFKDWKQHEVLASKGLLELFSDNIKTLILNDEEWLFLIESSFSVYWWDKENEFVKTVCKKTLIKICTKLIDYKNKDVAQNAVRAIGNLKDKALFPIFKKIIESPLRSVAVKETAISQFWFNMFDMRILDTLENIINNSKEFKLRKAAIYAFASNLSHLSTSDKKLIENKIGIIYKAFDDSKSDVRRQATDVMHYTLVNIKSIEPLINRLKVERTMSVRKSIVAALGSLIRKGRGGEIISPILKKISSDKNEDYRVREEASRSIKALLVA